jgi:hypothetical protein
VPRPGMHPFFRPPSRPTGGHGMPPIPPPPQGWPGGMPMNGGPGPRPHVVTVEPKHSKKDKKAAAPSSVLGWMAGSKPKSSSKKYVRPVSPAPAPIPLPTSNSKPKHRSHHTSYLFFPGPQWMPLAKSVGSPFSPVIVSACYPMFR